VLFLELIVGFEGMRLHRGVACLQMRGQFDADRRWLTALLAPARKGKPNSIWVRHPPLQRFEDGGLHLCSIGLRQQAHQRGGDGAEIGAAFGGADQQGLTGRSSLHQTIGGAVLTRGALLFDQCLDVAGKLDLRVAIVAARMAGEHRGAVHDAYLTRVGEHRQHATNVRMGYGIIVQIETDIGCLVDRDCDLFEQRRRVVGQRQQARGFLDEHLADAASKIFRTAPISGEAVAPSLGLSIEIIEIGERASGEERITYVTYGSFHAAFFVAASDRHRARFITIVSGEAEQCRMEADRTTASFQDRTFQIVVE
jgi:hypothetical protein